ncbi:hypothetical protein PIB30_066727 [Stylosanthes scabra]|uniref:Replication factor A C-terminal domain-containing protein n=1 Tax=Stylosanthes scabra TaxID=79078 RepID=A0ABU6RMY1_9FABA|nr:hypothetical protein [Stylosanthes scabra]
MIHSGIRDDSCLVDFMRLLCAKSELREFTKRPKSIKLLDIERDDLSGDGKIWCALWEGFAHQLLEHLAREPASDVSISNTNYASTLYVNGDFAEVKSFRQRLLDLGPTISTNEVDERSTFVTYGTVMEIENASNWWYKAGKKCYRGLEVKDNKFHCSLCNLYFGYYTPRYCIYVRVMDESDSASFILWDKEVEKFLGIPARKLCAMYLSKKCHGNWYLEELSIFRGKSFLFKVTARLDKPNLFQPSVITVGKIFVDECVISTFKSKYGIEEVVDFMGDDNTIIQHNEIETETHVAAPISMGVNESSGDGGVLNRCKNLVVEVNRSDVVPVMEVYSTVAKMWRCMTSLSLNQLVLRISLAIRVFTCLTQIQR